MDSTDNSNTDLHGLETELSIEDENRMRAQLGLAPLAIQAHQEPDEAELRYSEYREEQRRQVESQGIRKRIEKSRTRRLIESKLEGKTLADLDEGQDEKLEDWVRGFKLKQDNTINTIEKSSVAIERTQGRDKSQYTSEHIKGLRVVHDFEDFKEGEDRILTLKDSLILDDHADELVDIGLEQTKKLEKNLQEKKKRPGYIAYDDDEFLQNHEKRSILSHYDEVLGETRHKQEEGFILSGHSITPSAKNETKQRVSDRLKPQIISLEQRDQREMTNYYSPEEMLKFKKIKRRSNLKKKTEDNRDGDIPENTLDTSSSYETTASGQLEVKGNDDDELHTALEQARLMARRKKEQTNPPLFVKIVKESKSVPRENGTRVEGSNLVISDTMEFVRSIRTNFTGPESVDTRIDKHPSTRSSETYAVEKTEENDSLSKDNSMETVEEIEIPKISEPNMKKFPDQKEIEETIPVVLEEPLAGTGIAATLALLKQKGMLEKTNEETLEAENRRAKRQKWLLEQNKFLAGAKETGSKKQKRLKSSGDDEVKRFEDYRPDVTLSYTDEFGRQLNPKEAFKQLCFAFHGMGSGKNKTEKRLRKIQEELLQQKLATSDASLSAMGSLQKKMEQSKASYVVLSSGNKAMPSASTSLPLVSAKKQPMQTSKRLSSSHSTQGIPTNASQPFGIPSQVREKIQFSLGKSKSHSSSLPKTDPSVPLN